MSAIRRRDCVSWLIVLTTCLSSWGLAQDVGGEKAKPKPAFVPKITIGKQTTWATEPVGPNGFIDYLSAVNRRHNQGVTPENNAVVLLYQATGPRPEGDRQPDQFFQLLGIEPLPDEGTYYEELGKWWQRKEKKVPEAGLNAIYDLQATAQSRPWKAQEFPEIAEWLRDNDVPLRLVAEATQRTEYYSPLVSPKGQEGKLIEVLLPGVQRVRAFARALIARAMLRLGEGDDFAAWRDLFVVHRLGRLVGRGPTLIEGLVGIAVESLAIDAELRLISETQPSTKFVARYLKQINSLPVRSSMADKIDVCERAMFLDCCHHLARGRLNLFELADDEAHFEQDKTILKKLVEEGVIQSVDWDEVLRSSNRWYDRLAAASKIPKYQEREVALLKLDADLQALAQKRQGAGALLGLLGGKPALTQTVTETLISLLLPAVRQAVRADDRTIQRMQNLEVAFALSAWRSEHDSYPRSLAELAPKYLAAAPIDHFTDQPLRYEPTPDGYRFYSFGENGKDDDGRSFDDAPAGDDQIVEMPKPLPK